MNLHQFTDEGVRAFHELLDQMKAHEEHEVPRDLLTDPVFSTDLGIRLPSTPKNLDSRFALAIWLSSALEPTLRASIGSAGMWSWLAAHLMDVIAPARADGTRKIGERSLYVLEEDTWNRYYRHLIAGPCRVVRAHWESPTDARAILAGKPSVPGELYEQIASRQEVITTPVLLRLTQQLYWDVSAKGLRRGTAGKGAGSARRLASVLQQLDLTWDLNEMTEDEVIRLLPRREFSRFLN